MRKYSAVSKDTPDKPLDKAVWWTEYVLRHNGARHLRSGVMDLTWYQYLLLDVIAFLLLVILVVPYLTYIITQRIFCYLMHCCSFKHDISANSFINKKFL
jgi:glucuronosyltransferase